MPTHSRELQKLWLDARCASVGTAQQIAKMQEFLLLFLADFASRHDPDFRRLFGTGTDLAQLVVKSFVSEAKRSLHESSRTSADNATYLHSLLSALVILVSGFTTDEITFFAPLYELIADSAVITCAVSLHGRLSTLPESRVDQPAEAPGADLVALECLKLVTQILACSHEGLVRRCLLEASQRGNVVELCGVLTRSVKNPYRMSDAECPLSQGCIRRVASSALRETLENGLADLEESLVACNCPPLTSSNERTDTCRSGFAVSLACLMETIVFLYDALDRPFRDNFSFGAFASSMISAEDVLEVHPKPLLRIITCIETIATSSRQPKSPALSSTSMRHGLFKFVPGSIQTLKQKIVDAATPAPAKSENNGGVTCVEAFECLATLFICSTQPLTAKYYGEAVVKLVQLAGSDGSLADFFLRSAIESIGSLQAQQLSVVLEVAFTLGASVRDVFSHFLAGVVRALCGGGIATAERRGLVVDFLIAVSERSDVDKTLVLHEGALLGCLAGLVSILLQSPVEGAALLSKTSILSKVVVDGPSRIPDLTAQRYPSQVIECMLSCFTSDLSAATLVLRDMYTNILSKTGEFFAPLTGALAAATQDTPWRRETSLLLATFTSVLQRGKHAEKAVESNTVELLLTLLCQLQSSLVPNLDLHLIGTNLAFLLRLLRFSDVWTVFDATVTTWQPDQAVVQMVVDLCCGVFHTHASLSKCYSVFDGATATRQNNETLDRRFHVVFGPYQAPRAPFVELDHPLRTLVAWCSPDTADTLAPNRDELAALLQFLFASSPRSFANDTIIPFIVRHKHTTLLSRAANITDARLLAYWAPTHTELENCASYDEMARRILVHQENWLTLLTGDKTAPSVPEKLTGFSNPNRLILLGEGGGISGTITCTEEQWPSRDGYSVAAWVRWSEMQSNSNDKKGGTTIPLWGFSWTHSRKLYSVKLMINSVAQCLLFLCEEGESVSKVRTPPGTLKPDSWMHVVLIHDRGSFSASECRVFIDGRCVVAAPCSFPAPSWQPSFSNSALGTATRAVSCSIGSSKERPTTNSRLDVVSLKVLNNALSVDETTSLFCCGAHFMAGRTWSGRSGKVEFSLATPTYSRPVIRGLELCALASDLVAVEGGPNTLLTLSPPTSHVVLDLDARSLAPRETQESHFHNQEYVLRNATSASAVATIFTFHGAWSAGAMDVKEGDARDLALTHGGVTEWRRWMRWIQVTVTLPEEASLRAAVASKLVSVLFLCRHQDTLAPLLWGDILTELADCVSTAPGVFLGDSADPTVDVVSTLLSLISTTSTTAEIGGVRLARFVYCTVLLEHLMFNWHVLVNASIVSLTAILGHLAALLHPSNPFCVLNAQRFRQANFEDGFIYGLFMEWVPPFVLRRAVHLVGLYLRAIAVSTDEAVSAVLTVCALSVPEESGECRLGSQMAVASPEYVALVRNLLLNVLQEVCGGGFGDVDQPVHGDGTGVKACRAVLDQLCTVTPPCWFLHMMTGLTDPVTVALSCRQFVLCFHHSAAFRSRHAETGSVCFEAALGHYAHHEEVLTILLEALVGRVEDVSGLSFGTSKRLSLPSEWQAQDLRHRYIPLLWLALSLVKALSEALLSSQFLLYYQPTDVASYFAEFNMQAYRTRARVSKLRRCYLTVLFCVRFRRRGRCSGAMDTCTGPKRPVCFVNTTVRCHIAHLTSRVMNLIGTGYESSATLRSTLYSQNAQVNALDQLMWPILSSVRTAGLEAPTVTPLLGDLAEVENWRRDESSVNEVAAHRSGADDASAADSDGDDEIVTYSAPSSVVSLPHLDTLVARDLMDVPLESIRNLFLIHAKHYVRQTDLISATTGKVSLSGFVLALHRSLLAQPIASGTQTESLRASFLCAVWLKAAEQALDSSPNDAVAASLSKNVMAVGKYVLSRLVAGLAVPPETLAKHFRFLLMRFERQRELVRFARTALFEWFMFIVSKLYFRTDSDVARAVVNMVSSTCDVMLEHAFPTSGMAQSVALRLIELTLVVMTDTTQSDITGKRLCGIWTNFLNAHKQSPSVSFLYVGDGATDAWLLSPSDSAVTTVERPTWERFTQWFGRFHVGFLQILRPQSLNFEFTVAEPRQHLQLIKASEKQRAAELRRVLRRKADVLCEASAEWAVFQSTATVVDSVFLRTTTRTMGDILFSSANSDMVACHSANRRRSTLLSNGQVSDIVSTADAAVWSEWQQEPLRRFVRYAPPPCLPVRATLKDTKIGACKLHRNAARLLTRIASVEAPASPLWVGNIYHLVGVEAHISTLILTEREIIIVRCSQITPDGDFFIARIQPHTASTQTQKMKESTIYSTLRRFLPGQGATKGGGTTQTAAAFRFSQYYRQLRSDVSGDEHATVCRVPLSRLVTVHERLFLHLPAAMEFSLESGEGLLVVTLDDELSFSRPSLQSLSRAVQDCAEHVSVETLAIKRSRLQVATRQWASRDMGNQEYLAVLNDAASRSAANLGQYPVMPWVLADYSSEILKLTDASVYRPLNTPVGAIDPTRAQQLRERFRDWVAESGEPPFHFGTHYSTSAIVMYYLVRLEPLTTWSRRFQGGKLDLPDRLFHSIGEAWESSSGNKSGDVKELIPEFFVMPAFLRNENGVDLGQRRDGIRLGDVVLPPWALSAPHRFIHFNTVALESDAVSSHLNEWIDLIFGFKQQGEEAVKAVNVFSYTSYRDGVERAISHATTEEERKSIVASVDNFGQTPTQLFSGHTPHPVRTRAEDTVTLQGYLLQHLSEFRVVSHSATVSAGARAYAVNRLIFLEAQEQPLSCSWLETACSSSRDGSPQLFVYDTCQDAVQCYSRRPARLLAVTPSLEKLGCGQYTAMCITSTGSMLFVGTSSGTVIVLCRASSRDGHTFHSFLPVHSGTAVDNSVVGLYLFDNRQLVVAFERDCLVECWSVSHLGCTFAFAVHLASPCDDSPVLSVDRLKQHQLFVGVKSHTLCLFGNDGTLLSCLALDSIPADQHGVEPSSRAANSPLTCVCVLNCRSFDTRNLVFLGHADGTVSVAAIEAAHDLTDVASLFTVAIVHSICIDVPVTCLCAFEAIWAVGVGGMDGKTRLIRLPTNDSSDSD